MEKYCFPWKAFEIVCLNPSERPRQLMLGHSCSSEDKMQFYKLHTSRENNKVSFVKSLNRSQKLAFSDIL